MSPALNTAAIEVLNSCYGFSVETGRIFPLVLRGDAFYVLHRFSHSFSTVEVDYLLTQRDLAVGVEGLRFNGTRVVESVFNYHHRLGLSECCKELLIEYESGSLSSDKVRDCLPVTEGLSR